MSESHRLIRIFVASPSDIQEERIRLNTVVTELNQPQALADQLGCTLQLLDWREVVPGAGRPEAVILDQLPVESWDIFIGMLWHRFGTPTGGQDVQAGHGYKSGTEEEFKLAYRAWRETQRPHVLFYRCKALPLSMDDIEPEQLAKVRDFWREFGESGEHPALFHQYQTHEDFERRVRQDLNKLLPQLMPPIDQASATPQSDFDESLAIFDEVGELAPTVIEWLKRDEQAVQSFFSYYRKNEIDATDTSQVLEQLHGWHLIYSKLDQWFFTKVGVMLFGPADKLVRYAYTDVLIDNKEAGSFKPCNGYPLMRLLVELIETLKPLWKEVGDDPSSRDDKGRPIRFGLYPQTALIEAAVNLVIHRDYEVNDPAHVIIYEDRIEFVNPGTSPYEEAELLAEKEFWPKYDRNPHLINVVSRTELNQRQGGGIARIIRSLRQNGNIFPDGRPALEIVNDKERNRFRLVIYKRKRPLSAYDAVSGSEETSTVNIYSTTQQALLTPGVAPPLPPLMVGREDDMAALEQRLAGETETTLLTAIRGWPGIGKTTLAAALAHDDKLKDTFPDGVLWIALGQEPGVHLGLGDWLTALSEDPRSYPTSEARSQRLAALLRQKRMLLIVDDVWEATDAQPFLVGGNDCRSLITTREPKVARDLGLPEQAIYKLLILSEEASLELLRNIAPSVVDSDPEGARRLVNELEGLPLALHVAGRLLVEEAELGLGVSELSAELAEGARILEEQAPADRTDFATQTTPTIAALFHHSTDRLDRETHERFAILGAFAPKPATFDIGAIAAVWEMDDPKPTLRKLLSRGLIEPALNGRFQIHALLAAHARSLLET